MYQLAGHFCILENDVKTFSLLEVVFVVRLCRNNVKFHYRNCHVDSFCLRYAKSSYISEVFEAKFLDQIFCSA